MVHIAGGQLDMVTCRWLDDHGGHELVAPFAGGRRSRPDVQARRI